jgi:[ribosomal protein S5]-alanine N-acetyltransferase
MLFTTLPKSDHDFVALRPIAVADIPVWYEYLVLPMVYEHTSWNVQSPTELAHYADNHTSGTPSSLLRLAIADRSTNRLVGTIGFHTVSPEHRSAELAFDLAPNAWGKGIASHMCKLMVDWGHADVGLLRIQATALKSNAPSKKVLERSGFQCEGLLRNYRLVRGSPGDFWMYSHVIGKV